MNISDEMFAVKNPFDRILAVPVEIIDPIEAANGIILDVHSSAFEVDIEASIVAIIGRTTFIEKADIENSEFIAAITGRSIATLAAAVVKKTAAVVFIKGLTTTMRPVVENSDETALTKDRAAIIVATVEKSDEIVDDMLRTELIMEEEAPNPHAIVPMNCFMNEIQRFVSAVVNELVTAAANGRIA